MSDYQRANTDWLAACTLGLGVHWTAQTVPRDGKALPFREAVEKFRLDAFLDAVDAAGADYVLFTATHAIHALPCPHPAVDEILPGRTAERDLLRELAEGLRARGKHLIVYYNHSCNNEDDPAWKQAVGYLDDPRGRLVDNLCDIVGWLGETYGDLIRAWWFDSSYSLDPSGTRNTVTTELGDWRFPWERWCAAAKRGFPGRLVTFNAGVAQTYMYSEHQDYWGGELVNLETPAPARYWPHGLQWHGWTCVDDRRWVYADNRTPPGEPLYTDAELTAFVAACHRHQGPLTCNVLIFQDGTLPGAPIAQMARVGAAVRG